MSLWTLVALVPFQWRHSTLSGSMGRFRQMFDIGGAVLLAALWIPLALDFRTSREDPENEYILWMVGLMFSLLLLSFLRQTLWKDIMYPIMNGFGAMLSLLFFIFVYHGHNSPKTYQRQWVGVLG